MSSPVPAQVVPWFPTTVQTAGTKTLAAYPSATSTGDRLVVIVGVNNNQNDGVDISGVSDGSAFTLISKTIRQATGHDAVTLYTFERLNAASGAGQPVITFTGLPGGGLYVWAVSMAISGSHTTQALDIAAFEAIGAGTAPVIGPTPPSVSAEVLWLMAIVTPNIQATSFHSGSQFSQIAAGGSSGTGSSAKATGLVGKYQQAAVGTAEADIGIATSPNRQYAAVILAIPPPDSGAGTGGGGAPLSFPLGPPDMTGATTLNDPNPNAVWKPALTNGVDYVLNCPVQRTRALQIIGGRNVYVPQLLIKLSQSDSEMIKPGGGDVGRIIHIDTFHLDPNGFEADCIQTAAPFSGRHLQLRVGIVEKLIGSTNPVLPNFPRGIHADLVQSSGGIGQLWIEDLEAHTSYQGLQLQQEAKLGPGVAQTATGWTRSGTTVTVNKNSHGLLAGQYVSHTAFAESVINGGYKVATAAANSYTVILAVAPTATSGTGGTIQQMSFAYTVDEVHAKRYHMVGTANASGDPANALGAGRIGARTAPVNGSHPNEDQTPLTDEAWNGVAEFIDCYMNPGAVSAGTFFQPDTTSSTYSVVKAVLNTSPTPHEYSWPSWTKVTGKIFIGDPVSPFVVLQNGIPVSTTTGGVAPATPLNTTLPSISPTDQYAGQAFTADPGSWSGVDSLTTWVYDFQRRLAGSGGSYVSVQSGASPTYLTVNGDIGYEFVVSVLPANGSTVAATPAVSSVSNVVAPSAVVTLAVTVE